MAKKSGLGMQAYVSGYDVSGDVGAITAMNSGSAVLDKTGINSSAMERVLSHSNGELTWSVHFNDATAQEHDALSTLPTADVTPIVLQSGTAGDVAWFMDAKQVNYDWNRSQDGDLVGTVQFLSQGSPLESGKSITSGIDTHASATSSTSIDENGTGSTSAGATFALNITGLDSGTPTVLVEDSTNNSTWATLGTFTIQAVNTDGRIRVTGNVDRYWRATSTGTFTNLDFVMVGRRGLTSDLDDKS